LAERPARALLIGPEPAAQCQPEEEHERGKEEQRADEDRYDDRDQRVVSGCRLPS
jgi:hypothetical protein